MRSLTRFALLAAIVAAPLVFAAQDANPEFDRIKALAGEWEGTGSGPDGKSIAATATVRVVSAGSAVMMVTGPGTPHEMVTMFHRDDANLMATHYCSAMNQPRMRARPGKDATRIAFEFTDGTNLGAHPAHMQGLVLTMPDADHHSEEWTFLDGTSRQTMKFDLRRKK
jgi:hypothetical protein